METQKRGLSIDTERLESDCLISIKSQGKLTHQDYVALTPVIDSALSTVKDPQIKLFMDITELDGWELRALWDDFRLGLKHGKKFHKVAIYGYIRCGNFLAKIGSLFIAGEIKFFDHESDALEWLNE